MRKFALTLAFIAASGAAFAQRTGWRDYVYPIYSFGISFPAAPTVKDGTYLTEDGSSVEARIYSLEEEDAILKVTVADFSGRRVDEKAIVEHAIKTLVEDGEVKLNIPHRVNAVYGRQLSIAGHDGSHSSIAIFFYRRHLYQIEGVALPAIADASFQAIRFQQSLHFTNNARNRTAAQPLVDIVNRILGNDP